MAVNYVRHINCFYQKVSMDTRLYSHHISLYLALFQLWNKCRFQNPFAVVRADALNLCRIGSRNTYVRCLKELHAFGYIEYMPSRRVGQPSMVRILACTTADTQSYPENDAQDVSKASHVRVADLSPFNKQINKHKKNEGARATVFFEPAWEDVRAFFEASLYPAEEAKKFFHHYQANGWMQGGKTPIRNWQAAAHKWILNIQPSKSHSYGNKRTAPGTGHLFTNKGKDYSEPL